MTSKEFVRRLDLFHSLDLAASLFIDARYQWIFRIVISHQNSHCTIYSDSISFIDGLSLVGSDYALIDCFDRSAFEIQLRYFKGFLARLSSHQRSVLYSSGKVANLLQYINEGSK